MRSILIISFILLLTSCAKNTAEKVYEAIDVAQTYLSQDECQKAIDLLEDLGRQNDDPIYLQVLASAYACRAGFSDLDVVDALTSGDINTSSTGLFKSLSILDTSTIETEADSDSYTDLKTALGILLSDSSSAQPSQTTRNTSFGTRKAGDIGMQIIFMEIVLLGKFLNFYGNVGTSGAKGAGTANTDEQGSPVSTCFLSYTGNASTYINLASNPGGACKSTQRVSHPNLSTSAANLTATKKKLCEGLMMITNIIDVLDNISLSSNSSVSGLATVSSSIGTLKTQVTAADPNLATLLDTTSQIECESLVSGSTQFDNLQYIYALLFETGLQ